VFFLENEKEAFCVVCGKFTYFNYDGQDWVCQTCENVNTQADHAELETPYSQYED
jgi:hypothetical protein